MSPSPLHRAVLDLDEAAVAAALAAGGDADEVIPGQYRGTRRLLHLLAYGYEPGRYHQRGVIARLLLGAGADPDAQDSEGDRPLFIALHYVSEPVVRALVDGGADLTVLQRHTSAPVLTVAGQAGLPWLVERCLEAGADIHGQSRDGTPLHAAYYQNPTIGGRFQLSIARRLIAAGADVNAKMRDGRTPLHVACRWPRGYDAGIALLLESGADVCAVDGLGSHPLHWASVFGAAPLLRLLVEKGADLEARNRKGHTPLLHAAAEYGLTQPAIDALLDLGADVKAVGKKGESVLSLAVVKSNRFAPLTDDELRRIRRLIQAGADVTTTANSSQTGLLHRLAKGEHADLIVEAAGAGAPVSGAAKDGWTPLHNAAIHPDPATAAALLQVGADRSAVSTKKRKLKGHTFPAGTTARAVAEAVGSTRTAALL